MSEQKYSTLPDGRIYRWLRIAPGKDGRKAVKGYTPEEVEAKAAAILEALQPKKIGPTSPRALLPGSFAEFYRDVYFPRVSRNASQNTLKQYRMYFRKHIHPVLGDLPIASIGYAEVEALLNGLVNRDKRKKDAKPLSPKTKREVVMRVKELMGLYVEIERSRGHTVKDDWKFVEPPKAPPKKIRVEVDDDFTVLLLAAAKDTWLEGPLYCTLYLAMRRGEIVAMKPEALDRKRMRVRVLTQMIPHTRQEGLPKGGKTRDIPVPPALMDALERMADRSGGYIWKKEGKPIHPDVFSHEVPDFCIKHGLPRKTPHELRSLAATNLVAMGADLATVMEILGHSGLEMTLIYVDPKAAQKRDALARLMKPRVDESVDN